MGDRIVLFTSSDREIVLGASTDGETVWLTQEQMAKLFSTTKQNISLHTNNCFKEGELDKNSVVKESLTTVLDEKAHGWLLQHEVSA